MQFTSIAFAALVAATQFNSTFAKSNNPLADSATTAFETAVEIDVSANDEVEGNGKTFSIAAALGNSAIFTYDISVGSTTPSNGSVIVVQGDPGSVADSFKYTPNTGFVGEDEFDYTFAITKAGIGTPPFGLTSDSASATVKVTVDPAVVKQTFEIPGVVGSGNAIKYTHDGLFDIAAFTPAAPDTKVFTAIVKPVLGDSDNFVANTSPKNVQQNFRDMIFDFSNIFRDGN
jgi:hypothetical protein